MSARRQITVVAIGIQEFFISSHAHITVNKVNFLLPREFYTKIFIGIEMRGMRSRVS